MTVSSGRTYPDKFGRLRLPEGGYGQDLRGRWFARPPQADSIGVSARDVLEHADGTITVSGYINRGEWRATA